MEDRICSFNSLGGKKNIACVFNANNSSYKTKLECILTLSWDPSRNTECEWVIQVEKRYYTEIFKDSTINAWEALEITEEY